MCCNIHLLLIISNYLSLVFNFFPGTCHLTIKALKSLNNNQSKKKKNKGLNFPNNGDCHHYQWTSSSLKQTIANNI
jgi:hypothetical protein